VKRVTDKAYYTFSVSAAARSGLAVKCPKCGKAGLVTADKSNVSFTCTSCGTSKTMRQTAYCYEVENLCVQCGRFYRVHIFDCKKQPFPVLEVSCPYCGAQMPGRVQKKACCLHIDRIKGGREPFFRLKLWFLTTYRGKPVWALNRAHLIYLIDYLRADLREKPFSPHTTMRTQADQLPTFMKTAKNRAGIVKCLKKIGRT